ncbi:MAG: hypothetical protein CMM81_09970 [Rhodospirillales bacterium]|jgi:hypothetical protein|uniref:hypothetical protein n=1 Tax=Hwanghaeella sp. 1Z406 TaxID=3402811 RepID=UPI000C89494A|nr:hypothetical protein [Rhodospirillales bacterium]|tara:strand:+ start:23945 stop:25582 length:1638 start_codon:yes stop_codon:yes gene_type:complete
MASFKNSLPRASVDDLVARVKPVYGYRYVPSLGRFVRREEIPDDILNGRAKIAIPEPNPPVIQYASTGKAPTQGPKTIDTTQHPPSTAEDPIQASIERIRARQKPSPQPGASAQAQIDDFMKDTMQDRRYWHPEHKDDAYRDGVMKLWQISYPGRYQPGSWGRNDHPAVDLKTLQVEKERVLPPGPHKAPGPMQATPLSAKASAPSGRADQAGNAASPSQASAGRTAGNNSTLPQNPNTSAPSTPEARNAFAKGVAEHLGLIPKSSETGGQVAQAAVPVPGLPGAAAGIAAYEIGQQLGDKYGRAGDRAIKDAWDAITGGQTSVTPADPLPNQTQSPADAPDLDQIPKGRPDQSEETLGGYTLTFPDGSKHKDMGTLPPSEDQSDTLPQGTILNMKDDDGNPYNLDVSGAPKKVVDRYTKFVRKLPPESHRAIGRMISEDANLSTESGSHRTTNNVTKSVKNNPTTEMYADMRDFVLDHGGHLDEIVDGTDKETGQPLKRFEASNGIKITAREFSGDGRPTNEIQISWNGRTTHHLKFRYERAQK